MEQTTLLWTFQMSYMYHENVSERIHEKKDNPD